MNTKTIKTSTNNLFIIVFLLLSSLIFGQTTYVPDDNFESYLETHDANGNTVAVGSATSMGNGIANDDYVTTAKISGVTDLDLSNLSMNITDLTGISGFTVLINLNCSSNSIGSLNVSGNSALEVLICNGYSVPFGGDQPTISSLNLGTISSLKTLSCSINGLTSLDLSNQTNLISLNCSFGNLTSLNLANQINLTTLNFSGNNLSSINLTNQTNLLSLKCNYNNLGTLNVSNNTALEILECAGKYESSGFITNIVTITPNVNTLVLGSVNTIKTLDCANNLLTSLPLNNLNSLEVLDCSINNLGSLNVSNKASLIKLYCEGYTESFDIFDPTLTYHPNISSLNLGSINKITELRCHSNDLNNLDVSNLNLLEILSIRENSISTLNLSNNANLTDVDCFNNNLQILDVKNGNNNSIVNFNARNNTSLICLQVDDAVAANAGTGVYVNWQKDASITYGDNCATYVPDIIFEAYLETHDANGNIVSSALSMGNGISGDHYVTTTNINTVTNLDISGLTISDLTGIEDFTALAIFNCSANSLTSLDVSSNTALLVLNCFSNSLTSLDVSNNIALQNLACFQNAITSLNISQNTNLKVLNCELNQLTELNVANGNNANFTDFKATSNPNLNCIQIDTGFTPSLPIWKKDATAHFSTDCNETYVPDNNFETYLETHDANDNIVAIGNATSMGNGIANDDYVTTAKISSVLSLDVQNEGIFDLTGIEDFVGLEDLNCSINNLSSLDLSKNTSLIVLDCGFNDSVVSGISNLNITNNSNLTTVIANHNNLSSIDLVNKPLLTKLILESNIFTTINVSSLPALTILNVAQNQLTYLDISNNSDLTQLFCYSNMLTGLSVFDNSNLNELSCNNNQINSLVLPQQTGNLINLDISDNQVSTLDITVYTQLTILDCSNNVIAQLNVANGNNTNFTNFNATINPNLTCIQIDNGFTPTTPIWQKDATASYSTNCHFNDTYVPDNNFEAYLETHDANGNVVAVGSATSMGNGIANDDYVTPSNINSVTSLIINNKNISDLTGIEDFTALTNLDCEYNQLTTVDFTSNTALVTLRCNNNQIVNLDLFPNAALQNLYCNDNVITNIQISPGSLVNLYCENNQISLLDLSNFFNLVNVHCYNNAITSLDLLNSAGNLIDFRCNNNQLTSIDIDANINLTTFYCGNNQLTNLVLTTNTALEDLRCDNNQFTSLDVHLNTALSVLLCNNNSIPNIDIAQNTALTDFYCNNNQLTSLDLSQNTALVELRCNNNQLTNLVSPSTFLQFLNCNDNALTNLDVTQNSALIDLQCSGNQLTDIDVSANAQLAAFNCSANSLTSLNLKNGNNSNMTNIAFDATGNANLTCIEVDNVTYSTTTWTNIDVQTSFSLNCHYGQTYVPDNNFEQALINLGYDIVLDDYVTTSNISGLTILDVSLQNISDLTGIEDFVGLVDLNCSANNLTSLDVSNNTALTTLGCGANLLTTLDVQQNVALTELVVTQNQLTGLDVTQNVNLLFLACESNPFTSGLDITQNTLLQDLIVNDLNLTSLNISLNDDLQTIDCNNNSITALDFTGKQDLTEVRCQNNSLTDLYLRENPLLTYVDCSNNLLTDLTIDNGNNTTIPGNSFYATNNANLTCIQVDNVLYSTTNWTNIDVTAGFSTNCATFGLTNVPDNNFENYLETHDANGNVVALGSATSMGNGIANDDYVFTNRINSVLTLHLESLSIANSVGIENFTALTSLDLDLNALTSLDVTQNINLVHLDFYGNQISTIDLSNNLVLDELFCYSNQLTNLNLTVNIALTRLFCGQNQFTILDLTTNSLLINFNCISSPILNTLSIKNGNNNNITLFNATQCPNLNCIEVDNISIPSTPTWQKDAIASYSTNCGVSGLTNVPDNNFENYLETHDANGNVVVLGSATSMGNGIANDGFVFTNRINSVTILHIESLSISDLTGIEDFIALTSLDCDVNMLTSLNVTQNVNLTHLDFYANQVSTIDLSNNTLLISLFCYGNLLSNLDVSTNTALTWLSCSQNQFTSLDLSNNTSLTRLNCSIGFLASLNIKNGNNSNITEFNTISNPNLTCIQVDDITIPSTPIWQKDATANYSTNCSASVKIWEFGAWTNGVPTLSDEAIIRDDYFTFFGDIEAKTLIVEANKTVIILGNNYIKLQSHLINNGIFIVETQGSFVQVDNTATNTGLGVFETVIETTTLQDKDRFTYLASPSQTETLTVFNAWANTNRIWDFDVLIQDWNLLNGNEPMTATKGFAVKPATSNTFPFVGITEFIGPFNNGVYVQPLVFNPGGIDDDNSLVGNPYPSAIDASLLLNTNPGTNAFYFWTHKSILGIAGYISDDYVIWNNLGGIASVSGSPAPSGYIASGQGFFVEANAPGSLVFDNSMRVVGNNFDFRNANNNPNENEDKIWINLSTNEGYFSQILIGFVPQGSDEFDPTYDATRINGGAVTSFYSIGQNNERFGIEARGVLKEEKTIKLGLDLLEEITTDFTLSIDHFENLDGVTVFVKDNLLNRLHNLSLADYQFNINEIGTFNNRFELLFNRTALTTNNDVITSNDLIVSNLDESHIHVKMLDNSIIKSVKIYDVLGKLIVKTTPNSSDFNLNVNSNQGTVLFVKVVLANGETVSKKFLKL